MIMITDILYNYSTEILTAVDVNSTSFMDDPYPDFTQILAVRLVFVTVYVIVMVFAVVGNAVVCCTVFTNRKMHTAVNYYIVNLAVCDFMVGIFVLPVKLLELTASAEWGILNDGLCTAMMYSQTIFVFASVLTLVAICIERYMAVLHPLESRMHQTKSRAKKIILIVWIIPCFFASPFLYPSQAFSNTLHSQYGVITRLTCFISLPEKFRKGYYTFLFIFMYIVPLAFIALTCFMVAKCLLKDIPVHRQGSIRRQEANRRKVAKMVLMVVLAFAVSWTPYFIVSIVTQYQKVNFMEHQNFFFTMLAINLFAFLNSCVNAFIYAAMSTRFRNGFFQFFRYICLLGLCNGEEDSNRIVNMTPTVTATGRVEKRVRFKCQAPMSCLITQSSSDSGSYGPSDTSQRTACTVDNKSISLFRSLIKKKAKQTIIVQYIKNNSQIKHSDDDQHENILQFPDQMSSLKSGAFRKSSSSGELSSLLNASDTSALIRSSRQWFSCLDVKSQDEEFFKLDN